MKERTFMSAGNDLLPRIYHLTSSRIRHKLLAWFEREGRSFPWRSVERALDRPAGEAIHDPYMILVSEVMLQQTQTSRVAEKLPLFLEKFPTTESLARASRGELLRAWQGMGYNRRALRLQEAAREVIERHGGEFPRTVAELAALPGVGRYTASAVACFAFGADVPVVDVNVIRVLSRLFYKCHTAGETMPARTIDRVAEAIVPAGDAYRWHQALMDLGATICTARRPACERCPLAADCLSAHPSEIELFGARHAAKSEPEIRGEPRRIWRGRIVELLRGARDGIRVAEIIDTLVPANLFGPIPRDERRALLKVTETLIAEGMVERSGAVREGDGLAESDRVRLPRE
jgi:A/G-specific adenine glycosylase